MSLATEQEEKKSLWKRWTEWNGSFLVLSIIFHVLLIAVAAWLVVGIVGKRKEKLKFTAPPPVPAAQEHHVGKSYQMQVICSEAYGGSSGYELMIQEKDDPQWKAFQLMQGVQLPDKKPSKLSNAEPVIFKSVPAK